MNERRVSVRLVKTRALCVRERPTTISRVYCTRQKSFLRAKDDGLARSIIASSSNVATGPRPWISRRTRPCFDRRGRAYDRDRRLSRSLSGVPGRLPPARAIRRRVPGPGPRREEGGVETASPPRTAAVRGVEAEAHPAVPAVPGDARLARNPGGSRTAPSGRCRPHRRAGTSRARPAGDWRVSFSASHRPAPRRRRTRRRRPWRPPPRGAP